MGEKANATCRYLVNQEMEAELSWEAEKFSGATDEDWRTRVPGAATEANLC